MIRTKESKMRDLVNKMWDSIEVNSCNYIDLDDKCAVIRQIPKAKYSILDGVGKDIWLSLRNNDSFRTFINQTTEKYIVDEEILIEDLYYFLASLKQEKLINFEIAESLQHSIDGLINDHSNFDDTSSDGKTYHNYDIIYDNFMKKKKPFKVFFELTYNCNLRCKHCYIGEPPKTNTLSLEKVKEILDQLKQEGVVEIVFTGGEVSLYKDYIEAIEYACNEGFVVSLLTNGTLLTEDDLERIKKLKLNELRISIYGFEEFHDDFVGVKGSFSKSIKILEELSNVSVAAIVIMNDNVEQMASLLGYLNKKGISTSHTPVVFPTVYGESGPMQYRVPEEKLVESIKDLNIKVGGSICTAGLSRFRITPDGIVNPCEMLRHISFGSLVDQSYNQIMKSEIRQDWLSKFHSITEISKCESCEFKRYCTNCIGIAYLENGDMQSVSSFSCSLAKHQYAVYEGKKEQLVL